MYPASKKLFYALTKNNLILVTAESLTGGMVGAEITRYPGSSRVYWGGMVVYAPEAKISQLGLSSNLIRTYGVVSAEVAQAMALGALERSSAHVSIAVTGIASPIATMQKDSSTLILPAGTVWIAVGLRNTAGELSVYSKQFLFSGGRRRVRKQTVNAACELVLCYLDRF